MYCYYKITLAAGDIEEGDYQRHKAQNKDTNNLCLAREDFNRGDSNENRNRKKGLKES